MTYKELSKIAYSVQDENPQLASMLFAICGAIASGTEDILNEIMIQFAKDMIYQNDYNKWLESQS